MSWCQDWALSSISILTIAVYTKWNVSWLADHIPSYMSIRGFRDVSFMVTRQPRWPSLKINGWLDDRFHDSTESIIPKLYWGKIKRERERGDGVTGELSVKLRKGRTNEMRPAWEEIESRSQQERKIYVRYDPEEQWEVNECESWRKKADETKEWNKTITAEVTDFWPSGFSRCESGLCLHFRQTSEATYTQKSFLCSLQ